MPTENNWLTHNLYGRPQNKSLDFNISINVDRYHSLHFDQAAAEVCEKLYSINNNIYVGLSGGIDSEYVFRKFSSLKIPFTPVIVYSKCYERECSVAFSICKEYNIEPVILNIDEAYIIQRYKKEIYNTLNSLGIGGIPALVMADYVRENNGLYIKAEHMVGEMDFRVCAELNEWDFYNDVLAPGTTYDFFLYTPEIVYSMVTEMVKNSHLNSQQFKCQLFNIPYRDKLTIKMSKVGLDWFFWSKANRNCIPEYNWKMLPKQFLERYFNVLL